MKKPIAKLALFALITMSVLSYAYINETEIDTTATKFEFQEIEAQQDKIIGSAKVATAVFHKALDFIRNTQS